MVVVPANMVDGCCRVGKRRYVETFNSRDIRIKSRENETNCCLILKIVAIFVYSIGMQYIGVKKTSIY